jgi:propanol-preferring alcohol dehydrogenase
LKVRACGVCRTDLHIVEGELPALKTSLIPGHQIVGDVVDGATANLPLGTRVGVSWIGGTDGTCRYCRSGQENLCDDLLFNNGAYAEFIRIPARIVGLGFRPEHVHTPNSHT